MTALAPRNKYPGLTERQTEVFDWMIEHFRLHGMPPTMNEVAVTFGFRSQNSVRAHYDALERKGYIKRVKSPGMQRGLARGISFLKREKTIIQQRGAAVVCMNVAPFLDPWQARALAQRISAAAQKALAYAEENPGVDTSAVPRELAEQAPQGACTSFGMSEDQPRL